MTHLRNISYLINNEEIKKLLACVMVTSEIDLCGRSSNFLVHFGVHFVLNMNILIIV